MAPTSDTARSNGMKPPSPEEVDDVRLGALAREWRERAARGDTMASGLADAFEAELRRRDRLAEQSSPSPQAMPPQRCDSFLVEVLVNAQPF